MNTKKFSAQKPESRLENVENTQGTKIALDIGFEQVSQFSKKGTDLVVSLKDGSLTTVENFFSEWY